MIKTEYWAKPIPDRTHDWSATDDEDEGEPVGYGQTEVDSLKDLTSIWRERYESERDDHEATIKEFEKQMKELTNG
jgi:hypothetical protein